MTAVRRTSVLVLAVLLAAATAVADTVVTTKEVISCLVVSADTNFVRFKLPQGDIGVFCTRDVREVRLSDSSRVAELASQLPQLRITLDSSRSVAASVANEPRVRFIRAELLSVGACPTTFENGVYGALSVRLIHVGVEFSRVRLGLALFDWEGVPVFSGLPVTAGYTIYKHSVRYSGSLYAMVPEVYVEATASLLNGDMRSEMVSSQIPFKGTLELVGSGDGHGIGASLAIGLCGVVADRYWEEPLSLYAAARLHLLRFRWSY